MPGIYDLMQGIQQQGEQGRQRGLAQLLGKAYGAPQEQRQGILNTLAQRGAPDMAMQAQQGFDKQDDNVHLQMAKRAKEVVALYKTNPQMAQQIYQNGLIPIAARAGVNNVPPQLDDSLIEGLTHLATAADAKAGDQPSSVQEYQYAQKNPGFQDFLNGRQPTQLTSIPVPGGTMTVQWNPRTKQMTDLSGNPLNADGSAAESGGIDMTMAPGADVPEGDMSAVFAAAQNPGEVYTPQSGGSAAPAGRMGFKPDVSTAEATRLRLAEEANQRAAEASQRAAEAAARAGLGNAPTGQRFRPDGTLEDIPGAHLPAKPPSQAELTAKGYYDRMAAAELDLKATIDAGFKAGNYRDYATAGQGPLLNWAASDLGQQYRQKQEDWVRAKLRKESGAVIGDDEMEREIKTYFPQPGDGANVIKKKGESRKIAIGAMRQAANRANSMSPPAAPQQANDPLGIL